MADRFVRAARATLQKGPFALPVLALLAVYVGALYRRAFAIGVLSDGWVLLEIGSRGFRKAPFALLSYHTIPVTNLLMAVLWKAFGLRDGWYQVVNLLEFVLVGWLLYLLGSALFRQPRVGLLASLLFLANSSFYEVPFWPTVGNFQSLAALLYLAGILALHQAFRSRRPRLWVLLFSLCGLAAFFTYEPAVTVFGVGLIYAAFMPAENGLGGPLRRLATVLGTSLPALAVVVGSKVYTSLHGYQAFFLPTDWPALRFRIALLVRGCIAIFSLRGADHKLAQITFLGRPASDGVLFAWLLGGAVAGALLMWKTRTPAVRVLTLWFAVHVVAVAVSIGMVSRHFYLAALPAALLTAWLAWSVADRVAAWLGRRRGFPALRMSEAQAATILVFLGLITLISGAAVDLGVAATLNLDSTWATRKVVASVQGRLAEDPEHVPRVALVNMAATVVEHGIGAYAFVNGLHPLLQLSTQGRVTSPELFYTYALDHPGKFANASQPISLGELSRRVEDPASLVLMFDRRTRTLVELNPKTWRLPTEYDVDSAPFLEWRPGEWPWVAVFDDQPLELPLRAGPGTWVAVRYRRAPGVALTVTNEGSQPELEIRSPSDAAFGWPIATFPVEDASGAADLTFDGDGDLWLAGVWAFTPPAAYEPETADFLPWIVRPWPHFAVEAPVVLPLSTDGCRKRPCGIDIEYLAERGRDFSLEVEGGERRSFAFGELAAPEWRAGRLETGTSGTVGLRIEPRPGAAVHIRRLAWEGAGR